jgi:hypothetical protein
MRSRTRVSSHVHIPSGLITAGLVLLLLVLAGCSGSGDPGSSTSRTTSSTSGSPQTLEGEVGQELDAGGVKLVVTGLSAVTRPLLPVSVAQPNSAPSALGSGNAFYQVWAKVENAGEQVVRVDPRDFVLTYDKKTYLPDLSRSGPDTLSLIMTGSVDLLLTYQLPEGAEPELLYRPTWFAGRIVVKGRLKPAGVI